MTFDTISIHGNYQAVRRNLVLCDLQAAEGSVTVLVPYSPAPGDGDYFAVRVVNAHPEAELVIEGAVAAPSPRLLHQGDAALFVYSANTLSWQPLVLLV